MEGIKITSGDIAAWKAGGRRIAALTAYDFPMTRLVALAGADLILVGDSLGMVVLGYPDTTQVTLADMVHHTRACARAQPHSLLAADLPFGTYDTVEAAVKASRALCEAGAEAVKAEGGAALRSQIDAIVAEGIPFLGHLGMLPQHVHEEGGYKIKGRSQEERDRLLEDGRALVEAGAFAVVLELVVPEVAAELTRALPIPTIGIGSGPDCDGQILVTPDLLGTTAGPIPRHVRPPRLLREDMGTILTAWCREVAGAVSERGLS